MSSLKVVWTPQFKKDYKVAMKSHLDMDLLDGIIKSLSDKQSWIPNTKITLCPGIGSHSENATSSQIGSSSTRLRAIDLS